MTTNIITCLTFLTIGHILAESCTDADLIQKIAEWSNTLPVLVKQDEKRLQNFRDFEPIHDNPSLLRNTYYKMVSETQQTACNIIKRIGGSWIKDCGFLDGEKIICMDNLHEAVKKNKCLIYSFGLADDWDFELGMAKIGCVVRAFDPNVEIPKKYADIKNLHFQKIGLSNKVGKLKNGAPDGSIRNMPVVNLKAAMEIFGDQDKEITYLKLDVEGAEFFALPEMVKSGVFKQIRQMGIEMHTGSRNLHNPKVIQKHLNSSLMAFKELQETYGFRLIAYNANGCMGKKYCLTRSYHNYHDLVFYKPPSSNLNDSTCDKLK